jgi:uncharacterized protein (UPF0332 family)
MHDRAVRALQNCPIRTKTKERDKLVRLAGIALGQARDLRTTADYQVAAAFTREEAEETLEIARRILDLMRRIERLDNGEID